MSCTKPLHAYRSLTRVSENQSANIYFKRPLTEPVEEVTLPCGQCISCRISRSREWALRCAHEASLWEQNCFLTLTIAPENLSLATRECEQCQIYKRRKQNAKSLGHDLSEREARCEDGSICKRDFQLFMKSLRKKFTGYQPVPGSNRFPIRYFHCGEYGEKLQRPHHHAILFNFNFPDRYLWKRCDISSSARNGAQYNLYRSKILEELWPHGYSSIGQVTWQSAAYVARYVTKKINGDEAATHYITGHPDLETGECFYIEPEYISMSRMPGIGAYWFKKYGPQQYAKDFIVHEGKNFPIPDFYDRMFRIEFPETMARIKKERRINAAKRQAPTIKEENQRNAAREALLNQRFKKLMRSLENDPENV